jgi:phosphohistidine phosphatase SixA
VEEDMKPLVVFLVRHAEKADSSDDPELSPAGHERAARLAGLLGSAEIEYIHTPDYSRNGLEPELYDPRDLPVRVGKLRETGGRHLVVGHNTTTPAMVELLGGGIESVIDEEGEYDRLYIVTTGRDGSASVAMLRYGEPYDPGR